METLPCLRPPPPDQGLVSGFLWGSSSVEAHWQLKPRVAPGTVYFCICATDIQEGQKKQERYQSSLPGTGVSQTHSMSSFENLEYMGSRKV